jgi:hypothetical protein
MALFWRSFKVLYLQHSEFLNIFQYSALGRNPKSQVSEERVFTKMLEINKEKVGLYEEFRVLNNEKFLAFTSVVLLPGY